MTLRQQMDDQIKQTSQKLEEALKEFYEVVGFTPSFYVSWSLEKKDEAGNVLKDKSPKVELRMER